MKKILFFVLLILLVGGVFWFWSANSSRPQGPGADGKIKVVVSGYVPYTVAKQIGGELIDLSMLLPANAEPHSFEPTPGAIIAVHGADVFIYVSGRIEPWVTDIAENVKEGAVVVEAAQSAKPSKDPHIWMDFDNMRPFARAIAQALQEKDPAHQDVYASNLAAFNTQLDELEQAFSAALANCRQRRIVHVGHLAFGNLARTYGLNLQSLTGTSHQSEHSVHRLAELVRYIRKHGVPAVFTEEMLSQDLAATVARETNVRVLPLYTVEEVSKKDFDAGITYGEYMRRNLHNLREGLKCRP